MAQEPNQMLPPETLTDDELLRNLEIVINDDRVVSFEARRTAGGKWTFVRTVKQGP